MSICPDGALRASIPDTLHAGETQRHPRPPVVHEYTSRRKVSVLASPSAGDCLREIACYARENGWHLATDTLLTGSCPESWKCDGILAVIDYQPGVFARIQSSGIPCVGITLSDRPAHLPRVEVDNREIGRIAANHFLKRGYRSFAWAPFTNDALNSERYFTFQKCLPRGHACQCLAPRHVRVGSSWQPDTMDGRKELIEQLRRLPRPTAIFSFNDCAAAEIIDGCIDAGLSIPNEIAVLGVGNDYAICESAGVPLSSIDLDLKGLVRRAASFLDLLMDGVGARPQLLRTSPAGVVARVSTDVVTVANPCVASALRYIAENYPDPMLYVADVAGAVGVSLKHLEKIMQEETGSTINERIIRARMQEASRLLKANPQARTSDIAALVGLQSASHFHRRFHRFYGTSPEAHRSWGSHETNHEAPQSGAPPMTGARVFRISDSLVNGAESVA